jgi:hypothetical protein
MNHAESQKLIDVRRRMKDHKGAEYAMKINHETWKKGSLAHSAPPIRTTSPAYFGHPPHPMASIVHSAPHIHHPGNPHYARTPYIGPPMGSIFSPMSVNPVTPSLGAKRPGTYDDSPRKSKAASLIKPEKLDGKRLSPLENKRASQEITPSSSATPTTPSVRHDSSYVKSSSPSKRKKRDLDDEEKIPFFGPNTANLSRITVLTVLSYLSNADKYAASQVCRSWYELTQSKELPKV